MPKIYFFVQLALCFCTIFPKSSLGQDCTKLTATSTPYESRCAATGSIKVVATGGSGSYKYRTSGPVNINYTTSDSITGLSAGVYSVIVNDIVSNCTFIQSNVIVPGTYQDPRFTLIGVNVSCDNGNNASITVSGAQFGRSPFAYSIVAPSATGVGTSNTTGIFTNLIGGDYRIQMTDSCGGIQTRNITLDNYSWWVDSYGFTKTACDNGNGFIKVVDSRGNVSSLGAIPGFMYGIVRHPGDTIWSSNPNFSSIDVTGVPAVDLVAKDGCGNIKKGSTPIKFTASVGNTINIGNVSCGTFSATVTNLNNFFSPDFCLYDNNNVQISCNTTGFFNNIPLGSYCIKAHDACLDTTISRCFTVNPLPLFIDNNVKISNKNCTTFSATITGQTGLTNPTYCLFDSLDVQIVCNNSGVFNNLLYGSYCIKTKDGCRDTTIIRCISINKPRPVVPLTITPSYTDCKNIKITVGGDSLSSPLFCLYDTSGALIKCNNSGVFDSLTAGNQCVTIYDPCYDTTITRCFNVGKAVIGNDLSVSLSNKTCSTFTVKSSSNNLTSAQYCLYNKADSLIACNTTGIFNGLSYGAYCLKAKNDCPDTLFTNCFTVSPPIPSVKSTVTISNKTCTTFTAKITSQQNLTSPQYCVYNSGNVLVACNSTGSFDNLVYGDYCIKIVNTCYDTTITRCFSSWPKPLTVAVSANKSCSYGYASFGISVSGGNLPVNIRIYRPDNSLFLEKIFNSNSINIDSIPGVISGQTYTIIATDLCGVADTTHASVTASIASHTAAVFAQCPSAAWQNGSGKIQATTSTNMGVFTVRIIKKNGVTLSPQLSPNTVSGGVFTFNDLGTGTYIINYKLNDACNKYLYDTVTINPYYYPNLSRSSAYQCDVSGFSIGAVANNGVGPFTYEIIGSSPTSPSINAGPQLSPIFTIDNGVNYSLVRLRALDACGNATLGDASILPLADYKILVDSNCFQSTSTLSVDTIFNSTYSWYRKENYNSTDSTYLGSGYSVFVPFLSASDTGTFICHIAVNNGCVKRTYVYNLTGLCYLILPVKLTSFSGKFINDKAVLSWKTQNDVDLKYYTVERKGSNNAYAEIGKVNSRANSPGVQQYDFIDPKPGPGENHYRLKLVYRDNTTAYSDIITLGKRPVTMGVHCYPNPVENELNVIFEVPGRHQYKVTLLNMVNQGVFERDFSTVNNGLLQIPKNKLIQKGIYVLKVIDVNSHEEYSEKIIFL
jgi:hypothetical protein